MAWSNQITFNESLVFLFFLYLIKLCMLRLINFNHFVDEIDRKKHIFSLLCDSPERTRALMTIPKILSLIGKRKVINSEQI